MTRHTLLLLTVLLLVAALPLRAQGGCTDSPEDPTVVLALVGGIGALVVHFRSVRARKR